jgi:HSP20 family molecular chaperone IbpA
MHPRSISTDSIWQEYCFRTGGKEVPRQRASKDKEKAMDASSRDPIPGAICMGRPSDESLEEEDDNRNIKDLVVSSEFGSPVKMAGPSSHVIENWLEHEAERLLPIHISLSESADALTIRADVTGIKAEDLKIKMEPSRVMITRRRARARMTDSANCADPGIRVIDLPNPVIVNKVRIAVRDGVLELDLAKVVPANQEGIEAKTA